MNLGGCSNSESKEIGCQTKIDCVYGISFRNKISNDESTKSNKRSDKTQAKQCGLEVIHNQYSGPQNQSKFSTKGNCNAFILIKV